DQQLDIVEFAAGSSAVDTSATGALTQLSKALADRPGLRLDIPAGYDAVADSLALVTRAFDKKLGHEIDASPSQPPAKPPRRPPPAGGAARAIEKLYVSQCGSAPPPVSPTGQKAKKGEVDSLYIAAQQARTADMEQRLKSATRLDPTELTRLGQQRALAIKD